jgi:uncharacterized protein (DUF362 family)
MLDRRQFIAAAAGGLLWAMAGQTAAEARAGMKSRVSLVRTSDREAGLRKSLDLLGANPVKGKKVLLKPNFNTADPFPASTHNETLRRLILELQRMGASGITIGERSGPDDTEEVLREKGIRALAGELGAEVVNFEALPESGWVRVRPAKSHWRDGFLVARPVLDAECVVSTCCLKTHRYGGVFTMSLKLSVGVTHKGNMAELHSSPYQRLMIAEINQAYSPSLIVVDGMEAFVDGGPMRGELRRAEVLLAGADRVAVDAVGVAVLKELGSNDAIMKSRIFGQEQIARAAELGVGAAGPGDIEIIAGAGESESYARKLTGILGEG